MNLQLLWIFVILAKCRTDNVKFCFCMNTRCLCFELIWNQLTRYHLAQCIQSGKSGHSETKTLRFFEVGRYWVSNSEGKIRSFSTLSNSAKGRSPSWASAEIFAWGQHRHFAYRFQAADDAVQMGVHKTLYLSKPHKMSHVVATVTKMRFIGSTNQVYYDNLHLQ